MRSVPPRTALAAALRAFFCEHLPLTRGLSAHTVRSYRDAFVLLLRFLSARHARPVVSLDVGDIGPIDLLAFLDDLETTRRSRVCTRNCRLAAVHAFARFLATRAPEHVEACQRLLAVPTKRGVVREVDYLEADEIAAILASIDGRTPDGVRDRALVLALFNTGARVQEILDVRPGDLQLDRPYAVRLRGKGRKERQCPLWQQTVDALEALLATRPPALAATVPVFRNHRGEPMTRFGVRYLLRRDAARAAAAAPRLAGKRVHPHTYRHSAAVHLLHAGVDLITISHWLGHASIETTNRYAVIDLETKRQALERAGSVTEVPDEARHAWHADASVLEWLEAL
jgi:site-specific recombinase XerD